MRRLLIAATLLAAATAAATPALAAAVTGTWKAAQASPTDLQGQTATLLHDGRVLVVSSSGSENAELYDPAADHWTRTAPTSVPRLADVAVRLDDGRVLLIGGEAIQPKALPTALASAEIYDPKSGSWTPAGSMRLARVRPTATLLGDGRVLVAGGTLGPGGAVTASAELYDPRANSWAPAAPMSTPRTGAGAVLLRTGNVLVVGGATVAANQDGSLASAEAYDPRRDQWIPTPDMPAGHAGPAVGLLPNGRVIVAGGTDWQGGYGLAIQAVEFYEPERNRWRSAAPLHYARAFTSGTVLSTGQFLVVGGFGRQGAFAENTAEVYDWTTGAWTLLPRLPEPRTGALVTALPAGRALVLGGSRSPAAEVFVPAPAAPLGAPLTVAGAVSSNLPLVGVTVLLALAVGAQALIGRRRRL